MRSASAGSRHGSAPASTTVTSGGPGREKDAASNDGRYSNSSKTESHARRLFVP